jgi:hypothetical protein
LCRPVYNSCMDERTNRFFERYVSSNNPQHAELDENGVDLSLIRENLKLSPAERLLKADRARDEVLRQTQINRQERGEDR